MMTPVLPATRLSRNVHDSLSLRLLAARWANPTNYTPTSEQRCFEQSRRVSCASRLTYPRQLQLRLLHRYA